MIFIKNQHEHTPENMSVVKHICQNCQFRMCDSAYLMSLSVVRLCIYHQPRSQFSFLIYYLVRLNSHLDVVSPAAPSPTIIRITRSQASNSTPLVVHRSVGFRLMALTYVSSIYLRCSQIGPRRQVSFDVCLKRRLLVV